MAKTSAALAALAVCLLSANSWSEELKMNGMKSSTTLKTSAIREALGKMGELAGEIYKVSFPRTDLTVTVGTVRIRPDLALRSWIAFKPVGKGAIVHGDLALTEEEVVPVLRELQQQELTITGLHNHLIQESPRILYLHFWGKGEEGDLASRLKRALSLTRTPLTDLSEEAATEDATFESQKILQILGYRGTGENGVLKISVSRPEAITDSRVSLPPSMGIATTLNFQAAGEGKVAATGDFVILGDEVDRVAHALSEYGIQVTALHNHLLHDSPDLYFLHFWAHDSAEKVAYGLKAALNSIKRSRR